MNQLPEGKYSSNLEFKVYGKKYGNSIVINVDVLEDIKKKYEQEINVIKNDFSIDKNIRDTIIAVAIDKTKTFEGALQYIDENNNKN